MLLREFASPNSSMPTSPTAAVPYKDDPDPALLGVMRTQCFLDVDNAATAVGNGVVFMYWALNVDGNQCPDNIPAGCAVSIIGFVNAFAWIASYISLAASSCAEAVSPKAVCASDWTAIVGDFGQIAMSAAAASVDCVFDNRASPAVNDQSTVGGNASASAGCHPGLSKTEALQCRLEEVQQQMDKLQSTHQQPLTRAIDAAAKFQEFSRAQTDRNFQIAVCIFDVNWAVTYLVRVILQLRSASLSCEDPKICAINILNVISSFAWIAEYIALAVTDCMEGSLQQALCSADISDLFAGATNLAASAASTTVDCPGNADPQKVQDHLPDDR